VNAGVLQAFYEEVDIEPPAPAEYAITVYAHFFERSAPGQEIGRSPVVFEPVRVKHGQSYQVTWNGPGQSTVVDCAGDEVTFLDQLPDDTYQGTKKVTPEHDAAHLLCITTAPGNVAENIGFQIFGDSGAEVELTPAAGQDLGGTNKTDDATHGDNGDDGAERDPTTEIGSEGADNAAGGERSDENVGSTESNEPQKPVSGEVEDDHAPDLEQ
jgi:hypothetical protein